MLDDTSLAYIAAITRGDQAETDRLGNVLDAATLLEQQQRDHPDRIRREAHNLAAAGIPVFPIRPREKRPLTRHGFKDATTDPDIIAAWFDQWPDANLGIPTGIAFDVVDIDGTEGMISMYGGTEPVIDSLEVIGLALTSRDGGRHLYVPVADMSNGANLWPGVDYRGVGGYVVAPPSIGANGRRYEWLKHPLPLAAGAAA